MHAHMASLLLATIINSAPQPIDAPSNFKFRVDRLVDESEMPALLSVCSNES